MKALILAAGQGTRLQQLTARRPKPMLPIRSIPVLEHTIRWLQSYGIVDIAVNVHHFPEAIVDYFGDGCRLGVSIVYSFEDQLLGTAGAAKQLAGYLDEPFVVVYGDVVTNLDLRRLVDFHRDRARDERTSPVMTLALYRVSDPTQCGIVDVGPSGRVLRFVEKPTAEQVFADLAFSGIMVCDPCILDRIPAGRVYDYGHDVIPDLLLNGAPIFAQPISADEFLVDIGTLQGYLRALSAHKMTSGPYATVR